MYDKLTETEFAVLGRKLPLVIGVHRDAKKALEYLLSL